MSVSEAKAAIHLKLTNQANSTPYRLTKSLASVGSMVVAVHHQLHGLSDPRHTNSLFSSLLTAFSLWEISTRPEIQHPRTRWPKKGQSNIDDLPEMQECLEHLKRSSIPRAHSDQSKIESP